MLVGSQTALKQAHHPKYHDFNAAVTDIFKIDYGHVQPLMGKFQLKFLRKYYIIIISIIINKK